MAEDEEKTDDRASASKVAPAKLDVVPSKAGPSGTNLDWKAKRKHGEQQSLSEETCPRNNWDQGVMVTKVAKLENKVAMLGR
jgi:hypothetical protein